MLALLAVRGGWQFGPGRWMLLGGTVAVMGAWPFAHAPGLAMCLILGVEGSAMVLVMISAYRDPRAIDVHIRHLREKLEPEPEKPRYILTVRGAGYRLRGA